MRTRLRDLGAPARLALFAVGLALVGGIAALAGAAVGNGRVAAQAHADEGMGMHMSAAAQSRASGLASTVAGYTLVTERTTLPLAKQIAFRFRIVDTRGKAVRKLDLDGGVRLHLIVVRRDFVGYQHLHPALQSDGSWSVPITLSAPGAYRAFADFDVAGKKTVLGHDLFVPGNFAPASLPEPVSTTSADGFDVALAHADLHAGKEIALRFSVTRNGRPVPAFQPYVGHRGHLVALRDGDLAYSHVHPLPDGAPGEIVFHTELSSAGRFRIFLQFKTAGVVHTAPFTVQVKR
ncbi:MAG: hypothetical protein JWM06_997 [Actinomycetia bacterium]|nr:hypothetical protein [Actinomycetes bacterium]